MTKIIIIAPGATKAQRKDLANSLNTQNSGVVTGLDVQIYKVENDTIFEVKQSLDEIGNVWKFLFGASIAKIRSMFTK